MRPGNECGKLRDGFCPFGLRQWSKGETCPEVSQAATTGSHPPQDKERILERRQAERVWNGRQPWFQIGQGRPERHTAKAPHGRSPLFRAPKVPQRVSVASAASAAVRPAPGERVPQCCRRRSSEPRPREADWPGGRTTEVLGGFLVECSAPTGSGSVPSTWAMREPGQKSTMRLWRSASATTSDISGSSISRLLVRTRVALRLGPSSRSCSSL